MCFEISMTSLSCQCVMGECTHACAMHFLISSTTYHHTTLYLVTSFSSRDSLTEQDRIKLAKYEYELRMMQEQNDILQ
jgi:hypothetical protein